jgi:uncharacterized protein (TIGR02147 family)
MYRRLAEHLQVTSVMISQIFKGDRDLTAEQAHQLSEFLGLSELATDYFILLVQVSRAGTHSYRTRLENKLKTLRDNSRELKTRMPADKELSEEARAIFYSRWYYSGVRLASSIEGYQSTDLIGERLGLPRNEVRRVVEFLVTNGLCLQDGPRIMMGPKATHLGADSVFVGRHHLNWRTKAISKIDNIERDELFYTAPMALSHAMIDEIRGELVKLIERIGNKVVTSESETLACLNIDWFKI